MENFNKLKALDLFSGIGGNSLGLFDIIDTITYCEADPHAAAVLKSRMEDGLLPKVPIFKDVTTLTADKIKQQVDIIIGGFPCQDISVAGKGEGIREGNRSGLFYQIMRLTDEIKPRFLFLENVPAIRTRGLDIVLQELTQRGYDCRWTMLSAAQVGANHKRERWFMLAYRGNTTSTDPKHVGWDGSKESRSNTSSIYQCQKGENCSCKNKGMGSQRDMADTESIGVQGLRTSGEPQPDPYGQSGLPVCQSENSGDERPTESELGGMVDGFSTDVVEGLPTYLRASYWEKEPEGVPRVTEEKEQRVERIKRLGNAVVPLQARTAFLKLWNDIV